MNLFWLSLAVCSIVLATWWHFRYRHTSAAESDSRSEIDLSLGTSELTSIALTPVMGNAYEGAFDLDGRSIEVTVFFADPDMDEMTELAQLISTVAKVHDDVLRRELVENSLEIQQVLHAEQRLDARRLHEITQLASISVHEDGGELFYIAPRCNNMQITLDRNGAFVGGGVR